MNILLLNWRDIKNPTAGGAEYVTFEHAKAWVKNGHSVTWFTSTFKNAKSKEKIKGIDIIRKGNFLTVFLHAFIFYLYNKKKYSIVIDEIHGIPFFTPLYVKVPYVAFIHEIANEIWDYQFSFPFNMIGKIVERIYLLIYKNSTFWTDANSTIDELVQFGIKRKNCIAIPCPISNKPLTKLPKKEDNFTCIFISRLVKMKGIEDVLKAFEYIHDKVPNAKLWIVGKGKKEYVSHLYGLANKSHIKNNVVFFGYISHNRKINLLKRAHILLHASVKEGWGLVVLEAASCATPTVAYSVAGLKDTVKNGETGILLEKNTPVSLADQSIKLFKNQSQYKELQQNCLSYVASFDWDTVTKQSLEVLRKLHIGTSNIKS